MKIDDKSSSFICTPYTVNRDYFTNRLCCQLSIKYITFTLTSLTENNNKINDNDNNDNNNDNNEDNDDNDDDDNDDG